MPQPRLAQRLAFALALVAASATASAGLPAPPTVGSATGCPADLARAATVPEGCPCIPTRNATFGACEAGFVCAQPWALQVAQAAATSRTLLQALPAARAMRHLLAASGSSAAGLHPDQPGGAAQMPAATAAGADGFVCGACSYGQQCPRGSALPPVLDPSIQLAIDALACPPGFYCPTPASKQRCPPGFFCPGSSVQPVTCNMTRLVEAAPLMRVPDRAATVAARVFLLGNPLQGNSCPLNSTGPARLCPKGFFCPTPSEERPCPAGHFCRAGSLQPQPCPFLTTCLEGSASASLSFSGLIILLACMAAMWLAYGVMRAAIRLSQKRLLRHQEAQERLWRLLHPLLGPGANGGASPGFRAFKAVRPRLALQFEGLGLELHDGRTILSDITGRFEHSRVAAVMGPSGAGKTTFLSVLRGVAGSTGRQRGRVLVNGREMRLSALRSITGFVPQEDVVHEDLTVRENLAYSARLRLSAAKPVAEQLALVEDCVDLLQLRHVQHQVVGSVEKRGISGGQRKRVNIGIELAAKPSLLFMDEPTSGLDSTAAADILASLTRVARLGATIITVIHQPRYSIFRAFDDVLLLGVGGRQVYLGPSRLALPYLESLGYALPAHENPADFAMDVIAGSVGRADGSCLPPSELPPLWLSHGRDWVALHSKMAAKEDGGAVGVAAQPQQRGVDPEQLALLEEAFDAQDEDGDGALDADGLQRLLEGLGLEPTRRSLAALVAELAAPRGSGLVPRHAFLGWVAAGGRSPTPAPAPGASIPARRVDTLYRVYSIEQYTIAAAMSEVAAATLTPGMRSAPTLRDLALAHHAREEAQHAQPQAQHAQQQAEGSQADEHRRVSSSGTPKAIHLGGTPQSPLARAQASLAAASAAAAASKAQHPVVVQEQPAQAQLVAAAESAGLLAWLGLGTGSELRATPGAASQFGLLLVRSGVKWVRNWSGKMMEALLMILAAVICGMMHGSGGDEMQLRGHTGMIFLTLGVLSGATSLGVFGFSSRLTWWREQERGVRPLSYFLAASTVNMVDVLVQPLLFLSIYSSMTLPAAPFLHLYAVGVLVCLYCTSAGTLLSLVAPPSSALMATTGLLLIMGGMLNGVSPNYRGMAPALRALTAVWAVEIVAVITFQHYPDWRRPAAKAVMNLAGYCGLDAVELDPEQPEALLGADTAALLDPHVYCANVAMHGSLVLLALGLILRLLTALAVAYCSRGVRLEPALVALGRLLGSGRRRRRRQAAAAAAAAAGEA